MVVSGQRDTMFALSTVKDAGAHWFGGLVALRARLDALEETKKSPAPNT